MKRENIRLAFGLWLSQLFLTLCCAYFNWRNLSLWDSMWYRHIVDNGYSATASPPPYQGLGNVGFFPGYPLLGWLVKNLFQVSTDAGLLIASSLASFCAWFYFTEYLDVIKDPRKKSNLIWVWIYPFSFFFVLAYSDSLGAAMTLGFIVFTERWLQSMEAPTSKRNFWFEMAALHGFGMTFTRVLSVVLILYPVLRALQTQVSISTRLRSVFLMLIAALGIASFFYYCQVNFGAWNFYFVSEKVIWGWSELFPWDKLLPPTALFDFSPLTRGDTVGRYVTILFGLYFCYLTYDIVKKRRFREPIAALYLVCGMFWGAYLFGRATWGFTGMGRYLIPIILLLIPHFRLPSIQNGSSFTLEQKVTWGFLALAMMILQIVYAAKFARNGWVA